MPRRSTTKTAFRVEGRLDALRANSKNQKTSRRVRFFSTGRRASRGQFLRLPSCALRRTRARHDARVARVRTASAGEDRLDDALFSFTKRRFRLGIHLAADTGLVEIERVAFDSFRAQRLRRATKSSRDTKRVLTRSS